MRFFDTKWWFLIIVALTVLTPIVIIEYLGFKPVPSDYECINYGPRAQDC